MSPPEDAGRGRASSWAMAPPDVVVVPERLHERHHPPGRRGRRTPGRWQRSAGARCRPRSGRRRCGRRRPPAHLPDREVPATGCTSAEYERPVSFAQQPVGMPAREVGRRGSSGGFVRPMAVSTHLHARRQGALTISRPAPVALAPASAVRWPKGNWVGARRLMLGPFRLRVTMMFEVPVHPGAEARVQRHGGPELLDDGRPVDTGAGTRSLRWCSGCRRT